MVGRCRMRSEEADFANFGSIRRQFWCTDPRNIDSKSSPGDQRPNFVNFFGSGCVQNTLQEYLGWPGGVPDIILGWFRGSKSLQIDRKSTFQTSRFQKNLLMEFRWFLMCFLDAKSIHLGCCLRACPWRADMRFDCAGMDGLRFSSWQISAKACQNHC